jgi:hypothetical protein
MPFTVLLAAPLFAPAGVPEGVILDDEREEREFAESVARLRRARTIFDFREADADFVARALSAASGIDFLVHPALRRAEEEGAVAPVTLRLEKVSVLSAMGVLAETTEIRFLFKHSLFLLTTPEGARPRISLRLYEIGDLTARIRDFPGPEFLGLRPPGREPPPPQEPSDRPASGLAEDEILDLVRRLVLPGSSEADPRTAIEVFGTTLAVRQTPDGHRKVREFLRALRMAR